MLNVIIIGSGLAGFSVADWLYEYKIDNIAMICESLNYGVSRNTGSDKQTYYKLSLNGSELDSPYALAKTFFDGGSCDGELAYIEAVNSVRCFMRLVNYGVNFPTDEFGGYIGYKTDHDLFCRATSVGPLTSKIMLEKLENKVLNKNKTKLWENFRVVEILVKDNIAYGVIALNIKDGSLKKILANHVIVATGAPAKIYKNSVYPKSQTGMLGAMLESGVKLNNFAEWQYGLSSLSFRWNVSGSYMQVLPRMVSITPNGEVKEFLLDNYKTPHQAYDMLFLKGYQWPFDVKKMQGSSRIDILVHEESLKGNKIFLDYTKNPFLLNYNLLSEETFKYLNENQIVSGRPIDRLKILNPSAYELFLSNGIDLEKDLLEIGMCAQHNNGGVFVDSDYQTNIQNLFAVGEAAGVFGVYRPGGSSLNSTQVGGLRVAQKIKQNLRNINQNEILQVSFTVENLKENIKKFKISNEWDGIINKITEKMSEIAGFYRDKQKIEQLIEYLNDIYPKYLEKCKAKTLYDYFLNKDILLACQTLCKAIICTMDKCGSRGSALYIDNGEVMEEDINYLNYCTHYLNGEVEFVKVKPIPIEKKVFEIEWKKHKERTEY